jgi:maltose phosphorylase
MSSKWITDEWKIVEEGFDPAQKRFSESIFSLGNEHMGMRGFFEEGYSGDSMQGTYIGGVYYPDKTKVGWWKNGYPEFFAKVLNAPNFIGVGIEVDSVPVDLAKMAVDEYRQELDMKRGLLTRWFTINVPDSNDPISFEIKRFLSMHNRHLGCTRITVNAAQGKHQLRLIPFLDGDVTNEDSNYNQKFWKPVSKRSGRSGAALTMETLKTEFRVACAYRSRVQHASEDLLIDAKPLESELFEAHHYDIDLAERSPVVFTKLISVFTSRDFDKDKLESMAVAELEKQENQSYEVLLKQHIQAWDEIWKKKDIRIHGAPLAQQGIRYNIFQLSQTYQGKDNRLNIGPKGFSGEKYGGSTYWDTEAFCLPFYLYTDEEVAYSLLEYRYKHLEAAKQNARLLGLKGALYPMVTMDGQECHNEWEITFEEIHRNGAIAYAIYHYTLFSGKTDYLQTKGIEILIELSRFWASRSQYHKKKNQTMILGVTGPNEYENNVNNNWYTNLMAQWTMMYALETLEKMPKGLSEEVTGRTGLKEDEKVSWQKSIDTMYFPRIKGTDLVEQHDLFMDKDLIPAAELKPEDVPLHQNWSWDRILRSCFIKQADVMQGVYFFPERFPLDFQQKNFEFYEPLTVHESSLSPAIHSIIASRIGNPVKAHEMYIRTARLDLENLNNDTEDGIHLTSMAGTWSTIVQGFAGIWFNEKRLKINPSIPAEWSSYQFNMTFRDTRFTLLVEKNQFRLEVLDGPGFEVQHGEHFQQVSMDTPFTGALGA